MGKRTSIDWSKHELITKGDRLCKIQWLKQPDTITHNVKFIHVEGALLVTGDFGRWSFSRDFNPKGFENSGVSDSYWCEKIETCSEQETKVFDSEIAEESIRENITEIEENYDTESEIESEKLEFWNELLNYCNDEIELVNYFRDNSPDSLDFESLPCCKKQNSYLDAIFDAFEEIIRRFSNCA